MATQYRVFPECNVDTNLVGHILGGYVFHKHTCNEVAKELNRTDEFSVGIIDADKRHPTIDDGFHEYTLDSDIDGVTRHIRFFIHNDGKRFLFTVKPAMDKFILDAAKCENVDMKEYGYPSDLAKFLKVTKSIQAEVDPKLRKLFSAISEYPELCRFRNTLKYLVEFGYNCDTDIAKKFFDGSMNKENLNSLLQNRSFV